MPTRVSGDDRKPHSEEGTEGLTAPENENRAGSTTSRRGSVLHGRSRIVCVPPPSRRHRFLLSSALRCLSPAPARSCSTSSSVSTGWKLSCVAHLLRNVLDVRLVVLRQDDHLDPRAVGAEHLLLQPADRQHAAAQRDLAGHRDVAAHRAIRHRRHQRRRDRDARGRSVLRDRARRHVDVRLDRAEAVLRECRASPRCSSRT